MEGYMLVRDFHHRTGWNQETMLDLALEYISNQGSKEAFIDFLEQQARAEEGYQPVDEWRGSVAQALRGQGRDDLADAFGALSDTEAQDYQEDHLDPDVIAQIVIDEYLEDAR